MPNEAPNGGKTLLLEPGTLWEKVTQRTEQALQCGALQPIATECKFVEQGEVNFLVRVLPNLARKDEAKKKQEKQTAKSGKEFNPFLPYDTDLFVTDISDTHLCLLNKFNVIDHHLLIVTRAFEEQDTWLTLEDFEAMGACLAQMDGLAFYNGGQIAGASQRHKHLQLVPLPLVSNGSKIPIEPLLTSVKFQGGMSIIPSFPFVHAIAQLNLDWKKSPLDTGSYLLDCYHSLVREVGLLNDVNVNESQQSGAYNLLATRQWMLLVPRSLEHFESISVNSLGFAGSLFVRNEEQMKFLVDCGPMTLLRNVAVPVAI